LGSAFPIIWERFTSGPATDSFNRVSEARSGLFPGLLREFLHWIDPMVLLSRIAPARNACRARQVSVSLLLRPDDCMGFVKSNLEFGDFVENSGNRGRKFLSPA
jgi:hypothetical protein